MAKTLSANQVVAEIASTEERISSLRGQIEELTEKLRDLQAVERVFARLNGDGVAHKDDKEPTIADKVSALLTEQSSKTVAEIINHLQTTWRSELTKNTLISTLYRMKEKELASNEDGKWFLIKKR